MAYQLVMKATLQWVGDGAGPMSVPGAQAMSQVSGQVAVPGGDSPTTGNISSACTTAAAACATALNANITQIQGWATGGG